MSMSSVTSSVLSAQYCNCRTQKNAPKKCKSINSKHKIIDLGKEQRITNLSWKIMVVVVVVVEKGNIIKMEIIINQIDMKSNVM